ncbi:MAG: carboxymuconolactone decarboxylase family protein [Bacteroidota bacterium]
MERISFSDIPQEMMQQLTGLEHYINSSGIEMKLLELMRLRVAQLNGCAYCVDMHHKELKHLDETDLRLSSLLVWEETNYFSDKEKAVLNFTEVVTKLDGKPIWDNDFERLSAYYSKTEIAILTLAVAQINTWTRLMKTFQIEPGRYKVSS